MADEHPDEWRLVAQAKPEYCSAILVHGHGAGQCRFKPGHNDEHETTCWSCVEDGDDCQLSWEDAAGGVVRWPGCVSDRAHVSHG